MTSAKQLYSLQELDLTLDRIRDETDKAEADLGSDPGIEHMEKSLQDETERLSEVQSQQKIQQLETESQRERSTRLDTQLYGGDITNPRDLESLEQEASHARELLEQQDAELLELALQAEESVSKRDALKKELTDNQTTWQDRQTELQGNLERSAVERESVAAQRSDLAATLDPTFLQRYETLRRAKGGLAVAKVERGLCQACRMSLPTQQQQRVRNGRQTVLCSSCGRILFVD